MEDPYIIYYLRSSTHPPETCDSMAAMAIYILLYIYIILIIYNSLDFILSRITPVPPNI